ncbi:MAG: hypothetical protein JXL97_19855 [Bacteroidales bacterium]|nr:hypothetical protein [Bacteroidales bacterium]
MKNKFGLFFLERINTISKYLFWIYFLLLIAYYYLIDNNIPSFLTYLFFLLWGLRMGVVLTIKTMSNKTVN